MTIGASLRRDDRGHQIDTWMSVAALKTERCAEVERDNINAVPRRPSSISQTRSRAMTHVVGPKKGREPAGAEPPSTVEPLPADVLAARPHVKRAKRRVERLVRPAYVNSDATWRKGLAGLAYDSGALGQRVEVVACEDIVKAEHLALLMAMQDADCALPGAIAFRVDSTAVANMAIGSATHLREVRGQIGGLLKSHPDWSLVLVEGKRNRVANSLACRPFLEREGQKSGGREVRVKRAVVVPADLVGDLRVYAYTVVGLAARDIIQVVDEGSRKQRRELLNDPRKRYEEACALLDLLGWSDSDAPNDVTVDLRKHWWALGRAINIAVEVAEDTLKDLDEFCDVREQGVSPIYDSTVKQMMVLQDLALTISLHYSRRV